MNREDIIEEVEAKYNTLLTKLTHPLYICRDITRGKIIAVKDLLSVLRLKLPDGEDMAYMPDKDVLDKMDHRLFYEDLSNQVNRRNERIIIEAIKENKRLQVWFKENHSG